MSKILAVETSCDETAVAILECDGDTKSATFTILGNALISQAPQHAEYGGVYPMLAKREHIKNLPLLLEEACAQAGVKDGVGIDLIAVTYGPGLEPALWTGITFAEELGKKWNVPVMGINHLEGHIISALLTKSGENAWTMEAPQLPMLALLISGGHTELTLMKEWFSYEIVGETRDDAVGEAFDKVARLLNLAYPGGPRIAELAGRARTRAGENENPITFPRPMAKDATCDFSFSGLKTAVLYQLRSMEQLSETDKENVAEAFESAARDVIVVKTRRALTEQKPETLVVGGGVSANIEMRNALSEMIEQEFPHVSLRLPHTSLTGDNAIMIGAAGALRHAAGMPAVTEPLKASGNLSLG